MAFADASTAVAGLSVSAHGWALICVFCVVGSNVTCQTQCPSPYEATDGGKKCNKVGGAGCAVALRDAHCVVGHVVGCAF